MTVQIKLFPILAGAIALSVSLGSIFPALAQTTSPDAPMHRGGHPNFLNLTPEQQAELEEIRANGRSQIEAILTAEQRAQLESERANHSDRHHRRGGRPFAAGEGDRLPPPLASLNLTDEQRSQIEAVMQSSRAQMDAVLTEEQRQQLQQHRLEHEQSRSQNSPADQAR